MSIGDVKTQARIEVGSLLHTWGWENGTKDGEIGRMKKYIKIIEASHTDTHATLKAGCAADIVSVSPVSTKILIGGFVAMRCYCGVAQCASTLGSVLPGSAYWLFIFNTFEEQRLEIFTLFQRK